VSEAPPLPDTAPWFDAPLARAAAAREAGQLPQSLLVHTDPGAGGFAFVRRLTQLLLCEAADARPCGVCRSCERVAAGAHPDARVVSLEEESKQIKVEQVREALALLESTSYEGRGSVLVFIPAEALNIASANALLKTLEEPRRDAYLILVASQPSLLPATVRSRCLRLRLAAPTYDEALAWLQQERPSPSWPAALQVLGVAPFAALADDPAGLQRLRDETWRVLADLPRGGVDVVRTAEAWSRSGDLLQRLSCLENCLTGLALRGGARLGDSAEMRPAAHLSGPELDINIGAVLTLLDQLIDLRQQAATPLNKGLALERFLWRLGWATARQTGKGV
jgi:DNA polymerase-3 subunit delta'